MPKTISLPDWSGQDVYLIGGGPSLRGFDFNQLIPRNTIGCNHAFLLGPAICKVCIFGDFKFWAHYSMALAEFAGWVASPKHTDTHQADWIHFFPRQYDGLATDKLAWNANTGAAAINLALILGAKRIYLLGYDCTMDYANRSKPESSHWHDQRIEVPQAQHYARFAQGFCQVADALPIVFPGRQVFNVSEGSSKLECFPIVNFSDAKLRGLGDG